MPIELNCLTCGERLRVADTHAGKRARCPKCQGINDIPAGNSTSIESYNPAAVEVPLPSQFHTAIAPTWELKLEDGRTFGPVAKSELDRWQAEGRITPRSQVKNSQSANWQWAGEVYPALGIPQLTQSMPQSFTPTASGAMGAGTNPFTESAVNPYNPYAPPGAAAGSFNYPRASWQKPHRGGLILTFGLLGFIVCALFAPFAVMMGHADLAEMKKGVMDREGHSLTVAGVVLGWIITVPTIIAILFVLLAILGAAVSG